MILAPVFLTLCSLGYKMGIIKILLHHLDKTSISNAPLNSLFTVIKG